MRRFVPVAGAAALITSAATAQYVPAELSFVDVPVKTLGGNETRFSRSMGIVDAADYTVWRGSAKADDQTWRAALWTWSADAPYETLPITALPDPGFGQSGAHGFYAIPEIGDEVVVGFSTIQDGTIVPCAWNGDGAGTYVQKILPTPQNRGGGATCVAEVKAPDGMTILIGGFHIDPNGADRPAIWDDTDIVHVALPAPAGGGRVTHIGDTAVFGWVVLDAGKLGAARWTPVGDDWEISLLDLDAPPGFDGARITCGVGDGLLAGEWTSTQSEAISGLIVRSQAGVDYENALSGMGDYAVSSVNGFFGTDTFTYTLLGSITDGTSNTLAWNMGTTLSEVLTMSPILDEEMFLNRTAVAGMRLADQTHVIGTTGTMVDGQQVASVLVGSSSDCPGDCNGDGVLNILDFVCFQARFQAGCP